MNLISINIIGTVYLFFGNISASKILWWFVKLKLFCSTLSERFSGQGERVEVRIKRKLSIEIQYNWIWCLKLFWNSHHNRFTLERSIWKKKRPRTLWSQWLRSWKPTSTSGGYLDRTSNNFIEQPPKECLCGLLALCIQRFWFRRRWRGDIFQTTWQLSHESNQISPGERQKLNLIIIFVSGLAARCNFPEFVGCFEARQLFSRGWCCCQISQH